MSQEIFSDTSPDTLSKVTARFAAWRNDSKRTKKIPEELWQAAVGLSNEYSINQISKTLRLNYTDLKKRVKVVSKENPPAAAPQSPMKFIELGLEKPSSMQQCTVTMEDSSGARMQIHLNGKTDLDLYELIRAFWSKQS